MPIVHIIIAVVRMRQLLAIGYFMSLIVVKMMIMRIFSEGKENSCDKLDSNDMSTII